MIDSTMAQYDKNGDGKLQTDELAVLMKDLDGGEIGGDDLGYIISKPINSDT
jgi:Ca2+-binding EF-hand superfamily protein